MYYVITDRGVFKGKTRKELSLQLKGKFDETEFKPLGPDKVMKVTDADIDFIQDKRVLSQIMFSNFFKKDNSTKVMLIVVMFLQCLILFAK